MQAVEMEAVIDSMHKIHVNLPDFVPPGRARMILLFEPVPPQGGARVFGRFRGQGHISEDFDLPLADEFWTGGAV